MEAGYLGMAEEEEGEGSLGCAGCLTLGSERVVEEEEEGRDLCVVEEGEGKGECLLP